MSYINELLVGQERITDIDVLNVNTARARIPRSIAASVVLENLRALISLPSSPFSSDIVYDLSTRSRAASGSEIVMQRFLTILMDPAGGNLFGLVPRSGSLTPQFRTLILNRVAISVRIARARMRRTTPDNAAAAEVLVSAFVDNVSFNEFDGSADVTIKLLTQSGSSVTAPITLGV
jgi:hypothetical protein